MDMVFDMCFLPTYPLLESINYQFIPFTYRTPLAITLKHPNLVSRKFKIFQRVDGLETRWSVIYLCILIVALHRNLRLHIHFL
jgi:hypothetical protein